MKRFKECKKCNGTGSLGTRVVKIPAKAQRVIEERFKNYLDEDGYIRGDKITCPKCFGNGKIEKYK